MVDRTYRWMEFPPSCVTGGARRRGRQALRDVERLTYLRQKCHVCNQGLALGTEEGIEATRSSLGSPS